jgi:putative hydrolase of the HAD superfamily
MTPAELLKAVFGGSDQTVLVGRVSEDDWWRVVGRRLNLSSDQVRHLRADLEVRETWNDSLLDSLAAARGTVRIAIVSNAWPSARQHIERQGMAGIADKVILSCEVGVAKPDPGMYRLALARMAVAPPDALFIDDDAEHVDVARGLGMAGHVHRSARDTIASIARFSTPIAYA